MSSSLMEMCALSLFSWGCCWGPDDELELMLKSLFILELISFSELELELLNFSELELELFTFSLSNSAYKGACVASICVKSFFAILPSRGVDCCITSAEASVEASDKANIVSAVTADNASLLKDAMTRTKGEEDGVTQACLANQCSHAGQRLATMCDISGSTASSGIRAACHLRAPATTPDVP